MPDEPIEQGTPGAEPPAPAESGPDYSGWFSEAGFDTKQLPDAATIKSANEFYSKYGSESELFTPADLTKKVDEKVAEYFRTPEVYTQLKEYFAKELGNVQGAPPADTEGVGVGAQALEALKQQYASRLDAQESALAELMKKAQAFERKQELDTWHGNFSEQLKAQIRNAAPKGEDVSKLEKSLRRRFASGEIPNDSPQAIAKAVKDVVEERRAEKAALLKELSQAGLIRRDALNMNRELKLEDALKDEGQRDDLLSRIINHGMPLDD
jgi:hypothetical protein